MEDRDRTPIKSSGDATVDHTSSQMGAASKKTIMSPERDLELPSFSNRESLSVQLETVRLNGVSVMEILQSLVKQVSDLQSEVSGLRHENSEMKLQLSNVLKCLCCTCNNATASSTTVKKSYSEVLKPAQHFTSKQQKPLLQQFNSAETRRAVTQTVIPEVTASSITVGEVTSPTQQTQQSKSDDFIVVQRKRNKSIPAKTEAPNPRRPRNQPLVGVLESTLRVVNRPVKRKALFVSRFHPDVSVEDITKSLKNQLKLKSVECCKLKTKFNSYSSFHVSVEEADFNLVNNVGVWPRGCLIAPFYGPLLPEQRFSNGNVGSPTAKNSEADGGGNSNKIN